MTENRVYNYSAGPSMLPESVLKQAAAEQLNFRDTGMSVMEMSHRSPAFAEIIDEARLRLRALMRIPQNYEILFLQGGATLQFAGIPLNLSSGGRADYAVTGYFSKKAAAEAKKYCELNIAADTAAEGYRRIPDQCELKESLNADYFYYCANNTVYGTEWQYIPEAGAPLVCDMSSDILSRPVDVSRFGLIFAGAQKNMGIAGLTVVIADRALLGRESALCPEYMSYSKQASAGSVLNTPPCHAVYMLSLMLEWIERQGGLDAMEALREERAGMIYELLDSSSFYIPHAEKGSRSGMNITFSTPSEELDTLFVSQAEKRGLVNLRGHKANGGIRASLYNAMPIKGAVALRNFMEEFEIENRV